MKIIIGIFVIISFQNLFAQANIYTNNRFIESLYQNNQYLALKQKVSAEFAHTPPGHWGEFVKGVDEDLVTKNKIIAFTFDACGGKNADGYDAELINFLRKNKFLLHSL